MARLDRTHKGAGYTKAVEAACEGFNILGDGMVYRTSRRVCCPWKKGRLSRPAPLSRLRG
jgi:hypothetical protein